MSDRERKLRELAMAVTSRWDDWLTTLEPWEGETKDEREASQDAAFMRVATAIGSLESYIDAIEEI